ncbi:unnamed protein product, partial [Phaeothamnion confervicola]
RKASGVSDKDFRRSFDPAALGVIEFAANSKSPQRFFFTADGKYMIKTQSEAELKSLLRFLPAFAVHLQHSPNSLITRFFGAYKVYDPTTKKWTIFSVTSNVFATGRSLGERYDLKGSTIGRSCSAAQREQPRAVLKDLDLEGGGRKLRLGPREKAALLKQLRADAAFLAGLGLMDYSLLVGVHHPRCWWLESAAAAAGGQAALVTKRAGTALRDATMRLWPQLPRREPEGVAGPVRRQLQLQLPRRQRPAAARQGPGRDGGGGRRRRTPLGVYGGGGPGMPELHVGLIDVLQQYTLRKGLETRAKGVVYDRHNISAVPPDEYAARFITFLDRNVE